MKKSRLISFITALVLLSTLMVPAFAAMQVEEADNIAAVKNYIAVEINGVYAETVVENDYLADHYAGAYIDKEGNYHICLTSEDALYSLQKMVSNQEISEIKADIIEEINTTRSIAREATNVNVVYHVKDYSYAYLSNIADTLTENMTSLEIYGVGVKQEDNVVDVDISASADRTQILTYLSSVIPDFEESAVRFIESDIYYAAANKTAYPGDELSYTSWFTTYRGTIGFHAKDSSGNYGLVTNSHVAPSGQSMKYDGTTIGTPTYSTIGGKIDAAFIPFSNTSSTTWQRTYQLKEFNTTTYGTIYDVASSSQIVEGSRVKKYGITSGVNYGYITYTSKSCTYYDHDGNLIATLTDCIYYDNISQSGDSGGPVGLVAPVAKAKFYLIGITFAASNDTTIGIGCKVSNIVSAFNITPVTSLNP